MKTKEINIMRIADVNVSNIEESIRASKYPMLTDTQKATPEITQTVKNLALSGKGEGHDQFLTGINVAFDLTCSNKMWVEMERYRFVFFVSSQSTMHRASRFDISGQCNGYVDKQILARIKELQEDYKKAQENENISNEEKQEKYLKLLYNLPSGFELTARLTTNYRALKTIYAQRKNHRLPEWRAFCRWVETLPYAKELIIGDKKQNKEPEMGN